MKLTPTPVATLADERELPLLTPETAKNDTFLSELAALRPDLCVTAAYGCFLPQRFLDLPRLGTLNIHPSLLPLYRGAAPLQRTLEAGDAVAGVTVAFTVLAMDAGPVLRQEVRPLAGDEQEPALLEELFDRGTELLLDALPSVWDGSCARVLEEQDESRATKAPKLRASDAELRLEAESAARLHNKVRAYAGWPGTWCRLRIGDDEPVRAKLGMTRVGRGGGGMEGGGEGTDGGGERRVSLTRGGDALRLVCGDGSVLEVLKLTMPGRKPVDAKSWWNGLNGREAVWVPSEDEPGPA